MRTRNYGCSFFRNKGAKVHQKFKNAPIRGVFLLHTLFAFEFDDLGFAVFAGEVEEQGINQTL